MEKLKAEFAMLQTKVAEMRSELDDFDKFFALFHSLKKNIEEQNQKFLMTITEMKDTLKIHMEETKSFKAQTIKHQVSVKKEMVNVQKDMDTTKKEVEALKRQIAHEQRIAKNQSSAQVETTKILKEMERMRTELEAVSSRQCVAQDFNEQIEEIKKKMLEHEIMEVADSQLPSVHEAIELNARVEEMNKKIFALDGMLNQFKLELEQNRNEQRTHQPPLSDDVGKSNRAVPKWVLRERKRNNIIIFGLQETENDVVLIHSLFQSLECACTSDDIRGIYRVGSRSDGKKRPIVVKFASIGKKNAILSLASQLRWIQEWKGVVITHDLTKVEYLEEKQREIQLKKVAEERNEKLTELEKKLSHWKVIGGRGRRRVVLMSI